MDDLVYAASDEHAATLDVQSAHRIREQHDAENEPRRGLADGGFRDAADIVRRRGKIAKNDGRRPPERNEGQHDRGSDDDLGRATRISDCHEDSFSPSLARGASQIRLRSSLTASG